MKNNKQKIRIGTLEDIVEKIPEDKIDYFLKDFKNWFMIMKAAKTLNDSGLMNVQQPEDKKGFDWIDNSDENKNEVNLNVKIR